MIIKTLYSILTLTVHICNLLFVLVPIKILLFFNEIDKFAIIQNFENQFLKFNALIIIFFIINIFLIFYLKRIIIFIEINFFEISLFKLFLKKDILNYNFYLACFFLIVTSIYFNLFLIIMFTSIVLILNFIDFKLFLSLDKIKMCIMTIYIFILCNEMLITSNQSLTDLMKIIILVYFIRMIHKNMLLKN